MDVKQKKKCNDDYSDPSGLGETMTSTDFERPFRKCPGEFGEGPLPNLQNDFTRAKAYLMRQCLSTGDNLWDHLSELLDRILNERPKDIGCTFEEFSYRLKETRFRSKTDHLLDIYFPPRHYPLSQKLMGLLENVDENIVPEKSEADEEEDRDEPDVLESFYYFEQGGIALPREEVFFIGMHLKKLVASFPVEKYRFWGKILGTKHNYYVAETELKEDEIARANVEKQEEEEKRKAEEKEKEDQKKDELRLKKEAAQEAAVEKERQLAEERSKAKHEAMVKEAKAKGLKQMPQMEELEPWPPIPVSPEPVVKKTPQFPSEPNGVGLNKKTYFVSRQPGDEWIQLPDVTPQEIIAARNIKRAFVGDLESEVTTFPPFPGNEKNLLRAQIARISAGTQISPLGYYTFNEEEEEDDEAEGDVEGRTNFVVNPDFEPMAIRDLVDSSMSFWVHHSPYILKQGRATWANPTGEEQAGEEEGEDDEEEKTSKEVGPALLTPLSEDSTMDAVVPWSVRKTSVAHPEHSIAIVRSNLWPGAYAYATEKKFDNIYIGYGHKFTAGNHSPLPMQGIQTEYPVGPEIMEVPDPTPEQEEEWRLAHEVKQEDEADEEEEDEDADADDEDE